MWAGKNVSAINNGMKQFGQTYMGAIGAGAAMKNALLGLPPAEEGGQGWKSQKHQFRPGMQRLMNRYVPTESGPSGSTFANRQLVGDY